MKICLTDIKITTGKITYLVLIWSTVSILNIVYRFDNLPKAKFAVNLLYMGKRICKIMPRVSASQVFYFRNKLNVLVVVHDHLGSAALAPSAQS